VESEFTMAIDGDTTLEPTAIAKLMAVFDSPDISAACGFVIPRHVKTIWERGRYVEYLFAFGFYKQIQDYYDKPLIASGCFSCYRTAILHEVGGWSMRTVAEDMDLTWTMYQTGRKVRFVPDAVCYPIEPHSFSFMRKQLKRWSHGFIQCTCVHWRDVLRIPYLRSVVTVAMWDAVFASLMYLLLLPTLAIVFRQPLFLLGYFIDAPAVAIPVMLSAMGRKQVCRALASLPAFFVLRSVNAIFVLEAVWSELIMKRQLRAFEKGH
jgi:biofilm PGA synthesis N-glycosyltransferase PgaC